MKINRRNFLRLAGIASGSVLVGCPPNSNPQTPKPMKLEDAIPTLRWTSYAPTNFNPNSRIYPNEASVKEDFMTLNDGLNFSYFEAFDQPWKSVEPHWGLFDANRNPKLLAQSL